MNTETTLTNSYTLSTAVNISPQTAFKALTESISEWWGDTDHPAGKVGDIFKVSWGEAYYQFEVTDLKTNEVMTWDCIDCNQIHEGLEGIEKEWVGTKLFWTVEPLPGGQTQISLLHEGLIPSFVCYEVCRAGWDHFVQDSLKRYLESN